ncbi:hypothetical protein JY97_16750 [Alkalispirochaeta odontotermitis]|nr:hypothetical protein JY97_16750 [Alkalispirochaeta odontotermitis]
MSNLPHELSFEDISLDIELPHNHLSEEMQDNKHWAMIGQDRAIRALKMGISIRAKGYNIYVAGEPGTGKHTAIMDILSHNRTKNGTLRDIAYVQNFQDPDKPLTLIFSEGRARLFKEELRLLLDRLTDRIVHDLDAESYKSKRDSLIAEIENRETRILSDFENQLERGGFKTIQTNDAAEGRAADIAPLIDGNVVLFEDLQDWVASGKIPESMWRDTRERYFTYLDAMKRTYRSIRIARENLDEALISLKEETIRPGINEECSAISENWKDENIKTYLKNLECDIIENNDWFSRDSEDDDVIDLNIRYGINIVIDRFGVNKLPVIRETNPTKTNLFGAIEAKYDVSNELKTNFMMIKSGALLEADGGFLILQAEDIFLKEGLWTDFKRALQTGLVAPEIQSTPLGSLPILMDPEPVMFDTTIILMGPARIYESLCSQDDDFSKLFKVTAEFSSTMPRETKTENEYAVFARGLLKKENLLPISSDGIVGLISYGVFLAEKRDRLSTRFSLIADLIREAHYGALVKGKTKIDIGVVKAAIAMREYMGNLPEEILLDQIRDGSLLIDVNDSKIGVVNGLAVLERGFYSFGAPLRITVAVGPGKEGVINIEREAGLSGELHDKGVFLLEGYLRYRYARRRQLSMTASIAVEQSFSEIDGDSASVSELAALLSAIADIPVRQDVAITGAINQQGVVQPVGGVHEKVRGFFQACAARGLTGYQGVIIPAKNSQAVILSERVMKAVKESRFHVWTANNIDEVMALLTGKNVGRDKRNGRFESGSFNEAVRKGLVELAKLSQ